MNHHADGDPGRGVSGRSELRAALAFIRWLLEPQTHVEALKIGDLRATVPEYGRIPHVPLIRPFLELPEFKQMMAECPDYALLADHFKHAYYGYDRTEAATKLEGLAEQILKRAESGCRASDHGARLPDMAISQVRTALSQHVRPTAPQAISYEKY